MTCLHEVNVGPRKLDPFAELVGPEAVARARALAAELSTRLAGRCVWNVNSTATGGGVAEMLRTLVAYARGAGVDSRWLVIGGPLDFFRVTKRLHEALHGEAGDGSPLGTSERERYEATCSANGDELRALVRADDVVVLHDPQTAGLAPGLLSRGARVVWRCHIGSDAENDETARGWAFLWPYLGGVERLVFSRAAYAPLRLDRARVVIVSPSIDPFGPKNQRLADDVVLGILAHAGIVQGPCDGHRGFVRTDGSPGRVDHVADILRSGPPIVPERPMVAQVSRWDRLKDPVGVIDGFARLVAEDRHRGASLVLAGPNVRAIADDPDGARVFADVEARWHQLPHAVRGLVDLVHLPMHDVEENAAIVNALQRHATIVVQKSLREGFGLTVTEAMWKARPVVASAVGGIVDQIDDGVDGRLVRDPGDPAELAAALADVLADPHAAAEMGRRAALHVRERFLDLRHLEEFASLLLRVA